MTHSASRRQALRTGVAGAAALALASPLRGFAQSGPLRLVVGYAAGGPVDTAARQFAPVFSQALGRTAIIDNRPGAAGYLGAEAVARSTPEAGLLYFGASPTLTITPHVLKGLAVDLQKDLTPIAPLSSYANVLVVNAALPVANLQELIAYAKANPGKLTYGSAGMGASNHLSGELFARQAGIQLTHVPYKGSGPAMQDVIAGQLSMMFDIVSTARAHAAGGKVRLLAVTSRDRNTSLPDVPTMREAGLPGYEVIGWYGVYGPKGMDAAHVAQLHGVVNRALADEGLRAKWKEQGYDLWTGPPEKLAQQQARDFEMWRGVTSGIKFE